MATRNPLEGSFLLPREDSLKAIMDAAEYTWDTVAERNRQQAINQRGADPLSPVSQAEDLTKSLYQGTKDIFNVDRVVDDVVRQGHPSAMNLLHMALGPTMGVQGKLTGGALRLLPVDKFWGGSSVLGDALPEALRLARQATKATGRAIKKAAPSVAGGITALPTEAEGGVPDTVLRTLVRLINEGAPTLLRPVGQRIGQAMPKKIADQQAKLERELYKLGTTPEQNENIMNIFNRQEFTVEEIVKAIKEVFKGG